MSLNIVTMFQIFAAYNCPSTRHKVLSQQCSYALFHQGMISWRTMEFQVSSFNIPGCTIEG
ncbi:unnamed protein product [Callosobruchus maculatus]|uniref:Uncharacterized protein n=2 Tax=Callosobruchus maculatus TaxID=64391 RepID=A0A653CT92_CALMS|nr:unnamed protein product [Callosobruchus maculatus]VEN51150.1 unnamed protein product [Callosobruchus maculatus]